MAHRDDTLGLCDDRKNIMQTLSGRQLGRPLIVLAVLLLAGAMVGGCSSSPKRPVLYPNAHLNRVGGPVGQQDIDACMQLALTSGVNKTKDGEVGRKAASGAAIGSAGAGAWTLVRGGSVGERMAAGAAAGAATGAVRGGIQSTEQSPIFKNFVNRCLSEKGYSVIGWQ
jgi:outer membrane lipoprotein SlyB